MVLGVLAPGRARQAPDVQVEPGRVELSLIVADGRERPRVVRHVEVAERQCRRTVGHRRCIERAAARLFVDQPAGIAERGQHEPAPDTWHHVGGSSEPGDGADRARREQQPHRVVALRSVEKPPADLGKDGRGGGVVVGEVRVADVRRQQDLVPGRARNQALAIAQRAVRVVLGVDDHVDRRGVAERLARLDEAVVREAKAPVGTVVARAVRRRRRPLRQRVQAVEHLTDRHRGVDRRAVLHEVQCRVVPVGQACAVGELSIRIADPPFGRNRPVADSGAARHLGAV